MQVNPLPKGTVMKKLVVTGLAVLALTAAVVQSASADANVPPTPPADVPPTIGQPAPSPVSTASKSAPATSWSPHGASYTQPTLSCLYGVPNTWYTRMIESAPSVRAADTTPGVDHQRIWLEELDYEYQSGFPQGHWLVDSQPAWVYADATDASLTNRWFTQDGKPTVTTMLFLRDLFGTPPTWSETMWNVLYVPGPNGSWQTTGFGTLRSKTTGITLGIPSC
jgi:hypothetical protein